MSTSPRESASGVASSTVQPATSRPAERADANTRTCSKPCSRKRPSVTEPTAPVPPTTPMRVCLAKLERLVERLHRAVDLAGRHVAGDLDRRGGDDGGRDPLALERRERLRCDSRMALHAGADHRHLAEVGAGAPG